MRACTYAILSALTTCAASLGQSDECLDAIKQSQNLRDTLVASSFEMEVISRRVTQPILSDEALRKAIADAVIMTLNDHAHMADVAQRLIDNVAAVVWDLGAIHETQRALTVVYHDGLWCIIEAPVCESRTFDVPDLGAPMRIHRELGDRQTATVRTQDSLEIIRLDTEPRQVRIFEPDWLQFDVLETFLFSSYLPVQPGPVRHCSRREGRIDVVFDGAHANEVSASLSPGGSYMVTELEYELGDGSRVHYHRVPALIDGAMAIPESVTVSHLKDGTGIRSPARRDYTQQFTLRSFRWLTAHPHLAIDRERGDFIRDERLFPPILYTYDPDLRITDADHRLQDLVMSSRRGSGQRNRVPSCGALCVAVLAEQQGADSDAALEAAAAREQNGQLSLQDLSDVCSTIGMRARAVHVQPGELSSLPAPAIVHLSGGKTDGHFVCVLESTDGLVKVLDPLGENLIQLLDSSTFANRCSGYALIME